MTVSRSIARRLPYTAGYAAYIASLTPLAHWRLGEPSGTTMTDAVGGGSGSHTGAYTGSPTLGVAGLLVGDADTAVTFASGKYGSASANQADFKFTSAFSIAVLVKRSAHPAAYEGIVTKTDSGSSGWDLGVNSTGLIAMSLRGTTALTAAPAHLTDVCDNARHLIVVRCSTTQIIGRVDGTADRVTVGSWAATTGNASIEIGSHLGGASPFLGTEDEVAIWNRLLTDDEVRRMYSIGMGLG
jgi:hypothetical protein